jgi:hypothetical protein
MEEKNRNQKEWMCHVCWGDETNNAVVFAPCGHDACVECVGRWYKNKRHCGMCRRFIEDFVVPRSFSQAKLKKKKNQRSDPPIPVEDLKPSVTDTLIGAGFFLVCVLAIVVWVSYMENIHSIKVSQELSQCMADVLDCHLKLFVKYGEAMWTVLDFCIYLIEVPHVEESIYWELDTWHTCNSSLGRFFGIRCE